jgi:low affinity Fe/Cu permease
LAGKQQARQQKPRNWIDESFRRVAERASRVVGSAPAFVIAFLIVVVWAVSGPVFGFSDTWQLVINTATTIVTFLMVFLIQNTQNRDSRALHLKLDELILHTKGADNEVVNFKELSDRQMERLEERFQAWAKTLKQGEVPKTDPNRRAPRPRDGAFGAPPGRRRTGR